MGVDFLQSALVLAALPYLLSAILSINYYNSLKLYISNMLLLLVAWYPVAPLIAACAPRLLQETASFRFFVLLAYILAIYITLFLVLDLSFEVRFLHYAASYFVNFGRLVEILFQPTKNRNKIFLDQAFRVAYVNSVLDISTASRFSGTNEKTKYIYNLIRELGKSLIKLLFCFGVIVLRPPFLLSLTVMVFILKGSLDITGILLQFQQLLCDIKVMPFNDNVYESTSIAEFWGQRWDTGLQTLLYNTGYRPSRNMGFSKNISAFNTFSNFLSS